MYLSMYVSGNVSDLCMNVSMYVSMFLGKYVMCSLGALAHRSLLGAARNLGEPK